jgi:hypothetical protein
MLMGSHTVQNEIVFYQGHNPFYESIHLSNESWIITKKIQAVEIVFQQVK